MVLFFVIPGDETINSFIAFFGGSFFIFTFFMISDPKTVPTRSLSRVFYASNIVLAFYILQFFFNEAYSLVLSLFVNTLTLPIIWRIEKYNKDTYIYIFFLTILFIMITSLCFLIFLYGRPDLLFDNICDRLICK